MLTANLLRYRRRIRVKALHAHGMSLDEIAERLDISRIEAYLDARRMGIRPRYTSSSPLPLAMPDTPTGMVAILKAVPHPVTAPELALTFPERYQRELQRVQQALHRLRVRGIAVSFRSGRRIFWTLAERLPMNLEDAQELILRGVLFGDVYPQMREEDRAALREWFVREPRLAQFFPRNAPKVPVPTGSGNVCPRCGQPLIRDGKCELCVSCGEQVGNCS